MRFGAFERQDALGHGGMGQVWRARHPSGVLAAVKVLRPDVPDAGREALQRELATMASLDHPHIAWVYDVGVVEEGDARVPAGSPWMAQELAERGTLAENYDQLDSRGVQVLLREVLQALAHAHARGLVHRDLKPSNVLVAADGSTRLTDFGMVLHADLHTPVGGGTPSYMAPEQIDEGAGPQGPWTDLYALGVLAWVLTTGRRPFMGDAQAVLRAHLVEPVPAYEAARRVPTGFGGWVTTLLQKAPGQRFQRASEALEALERLGPLGGRSKRLHRVEDDEPTALSWDPSASLPPALAPSLAGPRVRPQLGERPRAESHPLRVGAQEAGLRLLGLREPPLVERDAVTDALWAALGDAARDGRGRLVRVHGPAGVGRTRLLRWLGTVAHPAGFHVLSAGADGLSAMIRRALVPGVPHPAPVSAWCREHGLTGAEEALLHRMVLGEGVASDDARTGALRVVRALAAQRPVLLLADDVHLEPELLAVVERLLLGPEPPCVLAVVAAADEGIAAVAGAWERLGGAPTHALAPLTRTGLLQLLRSIVPLAPTLEAQIAERAAGSPQFAVEVMRAWSHRLKKTSQGYALDGFATTLPRSLTDAARERVERVLAGHPGAEQALEVAALLGPEVDPDVWRAAVAVPDDLVPLLLVERLAARSGDRWTFVHAGVREVLRERALTAGRLRAHHRRIAEVLVARDAPPERVAPHLEGAGRRREAGRAWLDAGHAALRDLRATTGLLAVERAQEQLTLAGLPDDHELRLLCLCAQCEGLFLRGQTEEGQVVMERVLALAPRGGDAWLEALLHSGTVFGWSGDVEGYRRVLGQVIDEARAKGDRIRKERAIERLARFESMAGHHELALKLVERVLKGRVDPGRAHRTAVVVFGRAGDLQRAKVHAEAAVDLFSRQGRLGERATTWNDLATMLTQGGDHVGAAEALGLAVADARRAGSVHTLGFILGSLGLVQVRQGAWEAAAATLEEASRVGADPRLRSLVAACSLWPLARLGRWRAFDVALAQAHDVRVTFGEDDAPTMALQAAKVATAAGHLERAREVRALVEGWEARRAELAG